MPSSLARRSTIADFTGVLSFFSSSNVTGRLPMITSSSSPSMTSEAVLVSCSLERWISRSDTQKTGSSSASPMVTGTVVPSFLHTTPWMASGMVTHWYFFTPP